MDHAIAYFLRIKRLISATNTYIPRFFVCLLNCLHDFTVSDLAITCFIRTFLLGCIYNEHKPRSYD